MNKVTFNLKNCHVAPIKSVEGSKVTFDPVIKIPGAVSLSIEPKGESSAFYADGIEYYSTSANTGYEGEAEFALIPDEFREKILKEELDSKKVIIENQDASPVPFALGFQIDGDEKETLFWYYNCTATRPTMSAKTNEESKTPQTETFKFTATGLPIISDSSDYIVRAKTSDTTAKTERESWFNSVYVPTRGMA